LNKAYIIAMVMICFNFVLIWFAAMEFFSYQPAGIEGIGYNTALYGFDNIASEGLVFSILSALGIFVASRFIQIPAFAMFAFTNIFWIPYLATIKVFENVLYDTPEAFQGILVIFTGIMIFIFAYALIQMSSGTLVEG